MKSFSTRSPSLLYLSPSFFYILLSIRVHCLPIPRYVSRSQEQEENQIKSEMKRTIVLLRFSLYVYLFTKVYACGQANPPVAGNATKEGL